MATIRSYPDSSNDENGMVFSDSMSNDKIAISAYAQANPKMMVARLRLGWSIVRTASLRKKYLMGSSNSPERRGPMMLNW